MSRRFFHGVGARRKRPRDAAVVPEHPGPPDGARPPRPRRLRQLLAWAVHGYTALGLVLAVAIALSILEGGADGFRNAFLVMVLATFIDATDGTLARAVRVKEVLPGFDGRRLDDLIDFLTYVALPLLLLYRAAVLPPGCEGFLLAPLLASAYGFCQSAVKTDDGYFLGFPSCWNIVAFHLYALNAYVAPLPGWLSAGLLVVFALLTFVPTRYLYPSQAGLLNMLTTVLGAAWAGLLALILWRLPVPATHDDPAVRLLVLLSLCFPAYFRVASWVVAYRLRAPGRPPTSPER